MTDRGRTTGRANRRRRGFNLIELLVVVAILALLMAILLPSLSRAKERARVAKCLANLRSIGQAAASYSGENDDLPWVLPYGFAAGGRAYSWSIFSEMIWGGGLPDRTQAQFDDATEYGWDLQIGGIDVYNVPPRHRPMNPYISPGVSWDDPRRDDAAQRVAIPAEIPDVFKCPSDSSAAVPFAFGDNTDVESNLPVRTWEFWGSSYAANWYWPYYYMALPPDRPNKFLMTLGAGVVVRGRGREMLRAKLGRHASEFILFYENRMNYALEGANPRGYRVNGGAGPWGSAPKNLLGWHRQPDVHAAVFRDGSARYQRYDTRYIDGAGWTTWPNRPWDGPWAEYEGY